MTSSGHNGADYDWKAVNDDVNEKWRKRELNNIRNTSFVRSSETIMSPVIFKKKLYVLFKYFFISLLKDSIFPSLNS